MIVLSLFVGALQTTASDARDISGSACKKENRTTFKAKQVFLCKKIGKKLQWVRLQEAAVSNSSNPSPSPTPALPTNAEPANDLISLIPYKDVTGSIYFSLLLRSRSSGSLFYSSGIRQGSAANEDFVVQDVWQNEVLGCQIYDCFWTGYRLTLNSQEARKISLQDVSHPDRTGARPVIQEMKFGATSNDIFVLTEFLTWNGAKSVLYRLDTVTGTRTPVFATYCSTSNNLLCNSGSVVKDVEIHRPSNTVYLLIESAESFRSENTSFDIVKLVNPRASVTLAKEASAPRNIDPSATYTSVYSQKASSSAIHTVRLSSDGEHLFIERGNRRLDDRDSDNEICKVENSIATCKMVSPFNSLSIIQVINGNSLIIRRGSGNSIELLDFSRNSRQAILNVPPEGSFISR